MPAGTQPESLAFGERLALIRKLLEWLRSLDLDRGELMELVRQAIALFSDFSIEKLLTFIDAVLGAASPPSPSAATTTAGGLPLQGHVYQFSTADNPADDPAQAAAFDWVSLLELILKLLRGLKPAA